MKTEKNQKGGSSLSEQSKTSRSLDKKAKKEASQGSQPAGESSPGDMGNFDVRVGSDNFKSKPNAGKSAATPVPPIRTDSQMPRRDVDASGSSPHSPRSVRSPRPPLMKKGTVHALTHSPRTYFVCKSIE